MSSERPLLVITSRHEVMHVSLRRELTLLTLVGLAVGGIVGSGIFMMPASTVAEAGPAALLSWLIAGIAMTILALVYAELGSTYPRTAGPYVFPERAFGRVLGFVIGWGYWVSCFVAVAAITNAFVNYLSFLVPGLAIGMKLTPVGITVAIVFIWFLTVLNILGVKWGGWYSTVTTVLKVIPLLIFIFAGLLAFRPENYSNFMPRGAVGLGLGVALAVWAYMGFEGVTIPAEEVRNPEKTIPLATIITMTLVTLIYLGVVTIFTGLIRWEALGLKPGDWSSLYELSAPLSDVARGAGLLWLALVVLVGAVFSTGGCSGSWVLYSGRFPYALFRGTRLEVLTRVHPRYGTPYTGLLLSGILATIFLVLVPFYPAAALVGTLTAIIPYALAAVALPVLRVREPEIPRPFKLPVPHLFAFLSYLFATYIAYWACWPWTLIGVILILIGLPLYLLITRGLSWSEVTREVRRVYWFWLYLTGIILISLCGDPYFEYENPLPIHVLGYLRTPYDLLACTVLAAVTYYLAVRTGTRVR